MKGKMIKERVRKTRSDKKRDMRPTVAQELYECIDRLSYITNTPQKSISLKLCQVALISTPIIEELSVFFLRDYWSTAHSLYPGHYDRERYSVTRAAGRKRLTIRPSQNEYACIERLAFSLSITPHATASILIEKALQSVSIVDALVSSRMQHDLDQNRLRELREVFRFINGHQKPGEKISFAAFMSLVYDHIKIASKSAGKKIVTQINDWLEED